MEPIQWRQPLPKGRPVNREELLLSVARNCRVIHVGFVDERAMEDRLASGTWLHSRLAAEASSLVGIDVFEHGVRLAKEAGFEAYAVDAQSTTAVKALELLPAELVIAGEVIEHLDAPGPFLQAMHALVEPEGTLIVTTPNAYRPLNFLVPLSGSEFIHPDHTAWHSPHTLRNLLERSGWRIETFGYYQNPVENDVAGRGVGRYLAGNAARLVQGAVARIGGVAPFWSDGLIASCRPALTRAQQ